MHCELATWGLKGENKANVLIGMLVNCTLRHVHEGSYASWQLVAIRNAFIIVVSLSCICRAVGSGKSSFGYFGLIYLP